MECMRCRKPIQNQPVHVRKILQDTIITNRLYHHVCHQIMQGGLGVQFDLSKEEYCEQEETKRDYIEVHEPAANASA